MKIHKRRQLLFSCRVGLMHVCTVRQVGGWCHALPMQMHGLGKEDSVDLMCFRGYPQV